MISENAAANPPLLHVAPASGYDIDTTQVIDWFQSLSPKGKILALAQLGCLVRLDGGVQ